MGEATEREPMSERPGAKEAPKQRLTPDELALMQLRAETAATYDEHHWVGRDSRALIAEVRELRTELAVRLAAESAEAAAGSYAGRAEEAEAEVERLRAAAKDAAYTALLRQRKAVLEVVEERDQARVERKAATARAEQAEARAQYLDEESLQLQRTIEAARKQRDDWQQAFGTAYARAEQAEAALADLRERLGETGEQWGVRGGGATFAVLDEDEARWHARGPAEPMTPVCRVVGEWRDADANSGCLCPHSRQPDGTLTRDGVLAVGCPVHDPDAGGRDE